MLKRVLFLFLVFSTVLSFGQKPKLGYMTKVPLSQAFQIANYEDKPVMVFIHSFSCYSSRKYIREVMNKQEVIDRFKSHFVCVNADMATMRGRAVASKYNVMILPVILLINSDQSIVYRCQMKIDDAALITEVDNFVTLNKVQKQIISYQKSRAISYKKSAEAIGVSYAKIDFKKDQEIIPRKHVKKYTMNLKELLPFEDAYVKEWERLKTEKAKKETTSK
ncbi:MAG: thioredoxin family protein [Bacteroidetes bacterium]|nr:thioredoxin family protein [Bacteroidota bacterium]